ncbi:MULTISPECIES: hypothetical protein [Methylobacterium]|jgi:hypothetical protein|uniref:hypothetical protein n=1 Tax=Methylobacterium TaxID=407 RepID=UPI00034547C1|nr:MULTISPECIES: hypothetical protein [Methylobacterium]KQS83645.1 hypothetical protein ASG32_21895 [Methylobacterium sp. Leaf361]MBN4098399.1 hypothetical protein [Methylobacterium sp. OT2]UIN37970.1 hypothetical protein LXM90_30115 [Methylobacterium oryzae]SEG65126.1 hypothetical protein SAMN04488144_13339 [Methylobacterium sp. 190mf]SEH92939.1 hypothetical protein SAMN02799636_04499 [Methylobacterium sp. 275MFSha3.1]
MKRAPFRILIRIEGDRRVLRATSEREAALKAESVLRRYDVLPGGAGLIIEASDTRASARIAAYLADVALEMEIA